VRQVKQQILQGVNAQFAQGLGQRFANAFEYGELDIIE
jgi:hypothetical protein